MGNTLKMHFPMIRDRKEVLDEIRSRDDLKAVFESWDERYQQEFLDICTGTKGVKMLYDSFFKEIMNPEVTPERLEEILSLILGTNVKILKVLPNDSARIAAENTLLVLDIVIKLEDGSIANVEIQRFGYAFPGQRSACYSADLLLRQYKSVRSERGKNFKYRDIKKVYTIVLIEKSTRQFWKFPDKYFHHSEQIFDTGLKLELLQEYIFIPLDIYKKMYHNKERTKRTKLEAWLTFLIEDDPEEIYGLISEYPEFKIMYEEIYEMCRNMENFMRLFSKELEILDSNTVQYMIDEMQDTIDKQKGMIDEQKGMIDEQREVISSQCEKIEQKNKELEELRKKIKELENKF